MYNEFELYFIKNENINMIFFFFDIKEDVKKNINTKILSNLFILFQFLLIGRKII